MKAHTRQGRRLSEIAPKCARARWETIPCEGCGQVSTPRRAWQRYCSGRCRAADSRRQQAERLSVLLDRVVPDDPGRAE